MESLERALTANRVEVERELANAEEELDRLRKRERDLEQLMARARIALGHEPTAAAPAGVSTSISPRLTLHEALIRVLRGHGNQAMTARELADEVNRSGLYRKGDGSPVEIGQIHARVHNYESLFVRESGRIRLRDRRVE